MNAYTTTASNPKNLLGHGDFYDYTYDRLEARDAARESYIDDRIYELESIQPYSHQAQDFAIDVMELIADNKRHEQDNMNRWLFQVWQYRNAKPGTNERNLRDYAVSIVAGILNDAIESIVMDEAKKEYC